MLAQAGIIKSHRGVKGGFSMAQDPRQISLRDVVEICERGIVLNHCLRKVDPCKDADTCTVARVWREAQDALTGALDRTSLADVI
jgi:Rrf2 family protein